MSEKYSKYELINPGWLTEEFIQKILRNSEKDETIKVLSLDIAPATLNNDHYGSVMYRTKIEYKNSKNENITLSLIVKTMPEHDSIKKDMLEGTFIFKTEIRMYSETIPKMEAILRKYGDDTVLGAKVYYASMEPHNVLIFEDLVVKGYSTLQNRTPNEEEVKRALMKIAKWHAVSHILAKEEPEMITNYNDGIFTIDMEKIEMFTTAIPNFINHTLSSDEELKKYIPLFENLKETLLPRCADIWNYYKRGQKAIYVLNHGDFHFKNMMFKHKESGELDDLMLVDFQTCYYGPSATDIMYSTYMLMDGDTRWNRRDEMIYYYFQIFIDCLKKFDYKGEIPKMVDLQIDLIKCRALETCMLVTFLPFVACFNDNSIAMDDIVESPDYRSKVFANPVVVEEVKRTLPRYLHRGNLEL
ncbi:uncharacterized protein LOC129919629 [Episyrphus balteatus]|uniref:uncharacterized protein LOC129919629 n=1 Tax=Episyrphus balteatus TaxID=286459 RepID=UPI002485B531|nr:uncharacterized protein LOC129919629 [Episyrphus balteatus]